MRRRRTGPRRRPHPRDLTPQPGRALDEHAFELSPDGRVAVTGWSVDEGGGGLRKDVVVIDTGSGERRTLLSAPGFDFSAPRVSPDGKRVVAIRERHETYDQASALTVVQVPLDAAGRAVPLDASGRGPGNPGPAPRAGALARGTGLGAGRLGGLHHHRGPRPGAGAAGRPGHRSRHPAQHRSRRLLLPVPLAGRAVPLRPALGDGQPAAGGAARRGPARRARVPPGPAAQPPLPGRLEEIEAAAADGTPLRAWLVLPESPPARTRPRRCCCGCTVARIRAGTPGPGGGTRG